MSAARRLGLAAIGLALVGCGSSNDGAPQTAQDSGATDETETSPVGCAPGEAQASDGTCVPAGVPSSKCGKGFSSDGSGGCTAVLPADACGPGKMASLGETTCRDVAPCADGTWGDVPVDATTQYVDASFAGTSDGSSKAPWKTIGAAVAAASSGAIVAVAAGSYAEDVVVSKPVRIWGKCPSMVEIVGSAAGVAAIAFQPGANASELHAVAVRGGSVGVMDAGALDVVVDRAWVHDTAKPGVELTHDKGASSLTLSNALVEHATRIGVLAIGAQVTVDGSTVRDTQPQTSDRRFGQGLQIGNDKAQRGTGTIRSSLFERNHEIGIAIVGSDVTIDSTLVRDMLPRASDATLGRGIAEQDDHAGQHAAIVVRSSVVERTLDIGIWALSSELTLDATVVRDTEPSPSGDPHGEGVSVLNYGTDRSTLTMTASLVDASRAMGLSVYGSDATITSTLVRGTQPRADGSSGGGVYVGPNSTQRANVTLRSSLVDDCFDIGVDVWSSDLVVEATHVRGIKPRASDGLYGDGLAVFASSGPTSAVVTGSRIEGSARAGVSNFGASLEIGSTTLECNTIPLDGESSSVGAPSFHDDGANACGCAGAPSICQVLSNGLAPPEAADAP